MAGEKRFDERRLDPAAYPFHCDIPARFADMDVQGHINNVATAGFYQESRLIFHREAMGHVPDGGDWAPVVASLNITFLREINYPVTVDVGVGVGRIGRTSFTIEKALFVDGVCHGLADTVTVITRDGAPFALPDEVRAVLEEFRMQGAAD